MRPPNGTLFLVRDIGAEWERTQVLELARHLELRLYQPVSLWIEKDGSLAIVDAIQSLLDVGVTRLTILPIGLLAIPERGAIPRSFFQIKRRYPNLHFRLAAPLTWTDLSDWIRISALDAIRQSELRTQSSAQLTTLSLIHPTLINLLVANHLAAKTIDITNSLVKDELESDTVDELRELESRIDAMLPPEYRGQLENVSPKSMGTASLKFDESGKVAWDEIWTSFCDLALAGGPPHRGTLLEAVTAEEANAKREQYEVVVDEISRGIQMVTSLPIVKSKNAGWVGVRCHNEEMAIWLMRAIIVENIMVRREAEVIYLPAGPHFTIQREIKNVITAVAKTVHYWTAHLTARKSTT